MSRTTAAVFKVRVGGHGGPFIIVSSPEMEKCIEEHRADLQMGVHPNEKLQAAFDRSNGAVDPVVLEEVPRKAIDTDRDHVRRLLLHEQWALDKHFGKRSCLNTDPCSGFVRQRHLRTLWRREPFGVRKFPTKRTKPRKQHPSSKPCVIMFHGERLQFPSVNQAAAHFDVYQPIMIRWLKGILPWPGTGPGAIRNLGPKNHKHLYGMTGWFLDEKKEPQA